MDTETLARETELARQEADHDRLRELGRMERRGNLDEATPKYAETDSSDSEGSSTDSSTSGSTGDTGSTSGDLEARLERAARLNELAGAEDTAQALRRIKSAEDPQSALQSARRRAENMGDEYNAGEFGDLLDG
jgi:hypothetical protein